MNRDQFVEADCSFVFPVASNPAPLWIPASCPCRCRRSASDCVDWPGSRRWRGRAPGFPRMDHGIGVLVKTSSSISPALGLSGERQLGDGQLVLHPPACAIRIAWEPRCARLLLVDLGGEQIADNPLRFVLALHGGGDDLVAQGIQGAAFMPNSLSPAPPGPLGHRGSRNAPSDGAPEAVPVRDGGRAQSAMGSQPSLSVTGVAIVRDGAGSRCRPEVPM